MMQNVNEEHGIEAFVGERKPGTIELLNRDPAIRAQQDVNSLNRDIWAAGKKKVIYPPIAATHIKYLAGGEKACEEPPQNGYSTRKHELAMKHSRW